MRKKITLLFWVFSFASGKVTGGLGPPGKPTLTSCRSPEKETFTCWWKPGLDGGLPTTYALYYFKDNSEKLHECPDYHTAGQNSCFFNKYETALWVNYNITVVATNKMGRTFSDPVDVDVAYIVQPHTPENVTVWVKEDKGWPFLHVSWESPHKADIRSGWITLIYELRSKMEGEDDWEEHFPGQQNTFNIFSVRSGSTYLVEVRCRPDHGFWSEWSPTTKTKVHQYFWKERYLWILILFFFCLVFLILTWIIYMNSQSLKHCILPPIPGPKIKGFDHHRLKNGMYSDSLNALMIPEFPPTSSSKYDDLLVEYLEVFVTGEQEVSMEEGKDVQDHYSKSESSTCDIDSGHGSCDSHTLLIDKETDPREPRCNGKDSGAVVEPEVRQSDRDEETLSSDACSRRVKTWPSVFTPLQQSSASSPETKQYCLSDTLFTPGSTTSNFIDQDEYFGSGCWESGLNSKQPAQSYAQTHGDVNVSKAGGDMPTPHGSTHYVEVQKVIENQVLLQPVETSQGQGGGRPREHAPSKREDYSKVKGVTSQNMLLLESGKCVFDKTEANATKESDCVSSAHAWKHKSPAQTSDLPMQEEQKLLASNGYVDAVTMFSVPMY